MNRDTITPYLPLLKLVFAGVLVGSLISGGLALNAVILTLLLAAKVDPDVNRLEYAFAGPTGYQYMQHNPLDDATVSAYVVAKALRALIAWPDRIEAAPLKKSRKKQGE